MIPLATKRLNLGLMLVVAVVAIAGVSGCQRVQVDAQTRPLFPLELGNEWTYLAQGGIQDGEKRTLAIDSAVTRDHRRYFHLSGFPISLWVYRDRSGNLQWVDHPGSAASPFLRFDADVNEQWESHLSDCGSSWMADDYAVVETPYARFDGATIIVIDNGCLDRGLSVSVARAVGPVYWETISISGPTQWLLTSVHINDIDVRTPDRHRITSSP
ncbi:MAG TPA: hypothetical protein VGB22_06490 [candidate division Zixibacteria bacterium]